MGSLRHKPEIDGLRAIAVLAVVLFHAGFGMAGGFAGVDVFFVISGYLITGLLVREWGDTGRIDLVAFFARRVRRIFPAMLAVIGVVLAVSTATLPFISDRTAVAESAAAALLFSANFFFQAQSGYFGGDAELFPLLHLWSLAVEEQFYIVWPLILLAALRFRVAPAVTVGLAVASLALAEILMLSSPDAAFFQMPARFWELAAGAALAVMKPAALIAQRPKLAAMIGLAMLAATLVVPVGHFPGFGAIPAVAGAYLILAAVHSGRDLGLAGALLRSRPMVGIGLISYSLYLWHWPLLALNKALFPGEVSAEIRAALVVAGVALAIFSYRYIESPFRRGNVRGGRVVAVGALSLALCACGSFALSRNMTAQAGADDVAKRTEADYPKTRNTCHDQALAPVDLGRSAKCLSNPIRPVEVAIWGDSHALAWEPFAWDLADHAGVAAVAYTRDSCPPAQGYVGTVSPKGTALCRAFNAQVLAAISKAPPDTLILAGRWSLQFTPDAQAAGRTASVTTGLRQTVATLAPKVRRVVLLGPSPSLRASAPQCIAANDLARCEKPRAQFDAEAEPARHFLASLAAQYPNVEVVDPAGFLCTPSVCGPMRDGFGLYWDADHVSSTAARAFAREWLAYGPIAMKAAMPQLKANRPKQ